MFVKELAGITLNLNTDTVCQLIDKANEFQAKEGVVLPEKLANSEYEYDGLQILADHQDDLTLIEASKLIDDLEPDQQAELLALLYLGRGDFEASEWEQAKLEARKNLQPRLTEYLFAKPQLPEYFRRALEMLGFGCE